MRKLINKIKPSKTPSKESSPASSTHTPQPKPQQENTTAMSAASAPTSAPQNFEKVSTEEYIKAISYRRTVYPLSDKVTVSDERIEEIVKQVLAVAPSSYNTQPMRVAIMLGAEHKKLWQIIKDQALPVLQGAGEQVVAAMSQRFEMFQAAYGSITFWESGETIAKSKETHKSAAHMFEQWGEHANGMLQFQIWTAVELEGLGANLQHMNMFPTAEAEIKKTFGIPEDWSWRAGLNIGTETAPHPSVPEKLPFSETLKVFKS